MKFVWDSQVHSHTHSNGTYSPPNGHTNNRSKNLISLFSFANREKYGKTPSTHKQTHNWPCVYDQSPLKRTLSIAVQTTLQTQQYFVHFRFHKTQSSSDARLVCWFYSPQQFTEHTAECFDFFLSAYCLGFLCVYFSKYSH